MMRNISWTILLIASLACYGCRKSADNSPQERQPTTAASSLPSVTHDPAQIVQLRNIVANRGIRAVPGAVHQLAESKAEGAFEAIASGLTDENLIVRMYCATALGTLGDERAVPLLRKALQSKYTSLRLAAVVGLGRLGPTARPSVADLAAMLKQKFPPMHPSVQHTHLDDDVSRTRTITMRIHLATLRALGQIGGPEAQQVVAEVLDAAVSTEMEWKAARSLKAMDASDALMAAGAKGKSSALRMLAEMKHAAALPEMLKQATDNTIPDARRSQSVYALGVLGDRRAVPALLEMLHSKSDTLSKASAWSLNMLANPQSLQSLLEYVQTAPDKAPGLYSATCAIGAIDTPEALESLRRLADHPAPSVREAVAWGLDERATADDLDLLVRLMTPPSGKRFCCSKALARLLPGSVEPLVQLLPDVEPEMQAWIAAILVQHDAGKPAVRGLLNSSNEMVRISARQLLWEQRDPAVPLADFLAKREFPPTGLDERDVSALKRIEPEGGDAQFSFVLAGLFHLKPEEAWPLIRPLFYEKDIAPLMRAYNSIGKNCPQWVTTEMLKMLDEPQVPVEGKAKLLQLLRENNCIRDEAVAAYRRFVDAPDYEVRFQAYKCLWNEASDDSMSLLARKALDGDEWARFCIGGNPDKRLAKTFAELVAEATARKETWVGGYVHCWPTAPGVVEYVKVVGSHYAEAMEAERRRQSETPPD